MTKKAMIAGAAIAGLMSGSFAVTAHAVQSSSKAGVSLMGDKKNANVNLSAFGFGLKVVAVEYESDDPPAKIISYYQEQLKTYGSVLQCQGSHMKNDDIPAIGGKKSYVAGSKLKCDDDDGGKTVELKVGTDDNQHIVSVKPEGKGSDFAIVWLRIRGKEGDI